MPARSVDDYAPRTGARDYLSEHLMGSDEPPEHRHRREAMTAERRRRTLDELEGEARDLTEHTRSKVEQMGERVRETAESGRDRVRDALDGGQAGGASIFQPDSQRRRHDEEARGEAHSVAEHARRGAEHAREGVKRTASSARDRLGDVSDQFSDWGERAREGVGDVASVARERLGDMESRAADWGERTRDQFKEYGRQTDEALQAARGRAQDAWCCNADAAKELGGTSDRECCLSLSTQRICARHALWVALPLMLVAALWYLRRRNSDKWSAGLKRMGWQRDADRTALSGKMMSAKDQAMEALREQSEKLEEKKDK